MRRERRKQVEGTIHNCWTLKVTRKKKRERQWMVLIERFKDHTNSLNEVN